jgi:hypothetical protein
LEKRFLVKDWVEHEAYGMIMKQLTARMRQRVTKEQNNRRRGRIHLAVASSVDDLAHRAKQKMDEQMEITLRTIKSDRRSVTVECRDAAEAKAVLEYNGGSIEGVLLEVTRTEVVLSSDEILDMITADLESQQEAQQWAGSEDASVSEEEERWPSNGRRDRRRRDRRQVYVTQGDGKPDDVGRDNRPPSPGTPERHSPRPRNPGYESGRNKGKGNSRDQAWSEVVRKGGGKTSPGKGPTQYAQKGYNAEGKGGKAQVTPPTRTATSPASGNNPRQWPEKLPDDWAPGNCGYCFDFGLDYHHFYRPCPIRLEQRMGEGSKRFSSYPPHNPLSTGKGGPTTYGKGKGSKPPPTTPAQ